MATTTLTGTTGNDILNAPGSVTTLVAGFQGNDTITLALAADEAQAGAGADRVTVAGSNSSNTVRGGSGNDTILFDAGVNTFGGSINMDADADRLVNTSIQLVGGSIGGNAGDDTISLAGGILNGLIGGGANADSIHLTAGNVTNSTIFGGAGKDTIRLSGSTISLSTVQSADGHDLISTTALADANTFVVAAGKGFDSIAFGTAVVASVLGGAGNDTITFVAQLGGGNVFAGGDADVVSMTAATTASSALTVNGGAGADIIKFASIESTGAFVVQGGADADALGLTASKNTGAFTAGSQIAGGDGADTIKFGNGVATNNAFTIFGGDGADSIYINTTGVSTGNAANYSIVGGDGHDTITFDQAITTSGQYGTAGTLANTFTVVGGAGTDVINFGLTALGGTGVEITGAIANATTLTAGVLGNYVYSATQGSGDVLTFNLTTITANTTNNWNDGAASIYALSAATVSALCAGLANLTAAGDIFVYDSGTDLVLGIMTGRSSTFVSINIQNGDELLKTTQVGDQGITASNFGFTVGFTSTGEIGITLS